MIQQIRKRLGRVKCLLIDELPYRNATQSIAGIREEYRQLLARIPPVSGGGGEDVEVHMLCGTGGADMGMWASWSLMRYFPAGTLILHSDGSLTADDLQPWRRLIPNLVHVTKEEGDRMSQERLEGRHPALAAWRPGNPYSIKAIDSHLSRNQPSFWRTSRILMSTSPGTRMNAPAMWFRVRNWRRSSAMPSPIFSTRASL
jgi:hypothetical protein